MQNGLGQLSVFIEKLVFSSYLIIYPKYYINSQYLIVLFFGTSSLNTSILLEERPMWWVQGFAFHLPNQNRGGAKGRNP